MVPTPQERQSTPAGARHGPGSHRVRERGWALLTAALWWLLMGSAAMTPVVATFENFDDPAVTHPDPAHLPGVGRGSERPWANQEEQTRPRRESPSAGAGDASPDGAASPLQASKPGAESSATLVADSQSQNQDLTRHGQATSSSGDTPPPAPPAATIPTAPTPHEADEPQIPPAMASAMVPARASSAPPARRRSPAGGAALPYLLTGSFAQEEHAHQAATLLYSPDQPVWLHVHEHNGQNLTRVLLGPFDSGAQALEHLTQRRAMGQDGAILWLPPSRVVLWNHQTAASAPSHSAPPAPILAAVTTPPVQDSPAVTAPPVQDSPAVTAPPVQDSPAVTAPPVQDSPAVIAPKAPVLVAEAPAPAQEQPAAPVPTVSATVPQAVTADSIVPGESALPAAQAGTGATTQTLSPAVAASRADPREPSSLVQTPEPASAQTEVESPKAPDSDALADAAPVADAAGVFILHTGSYVEEQHAREAAATLTEAGYPVHVRATRVDRLPVRQVLVGPYTMQDQAEEAARQIRALDSSLQVDLLIVRRSR
ncbi:MAG: SPOR domain-containing protein [Magnetococcus sp. WYHC-3]